MKKFIMVYFILFLTACSGGEFSDDLQERVVKLVVKTDTADPPEMITFATTNKEMIDQFLQMMDSMPLNQTNKASSVFSETFKLYNDKDEELMSVRFTGENIAVMDNANYEIDEVKLRQFTDQLYTDQYLVEKSPSESSY